MPVVVVPVDPYRLIQVVTGELVALEVEVMVHPPDMTIQVTDMMEQLIQVAVVVEVVSAHRQMVEVVMVVQVS